MASHCTPASEADHVHATNPKHNLLTLPQELQDIIFDHAYPLHTDVKYISKDHWEARERNACRHDETHIARPFLPSITNDWLVSKRFLVAAGRAYVQNQDFGDWNQLSYSSRMSERTGVFLNYVTRVSASSWLVHSLHRLTNLRYVTVTVYPQAFSTLEPTKYVWRHELSDDEFEATSVYKELLACSSLRLITAIAGWCEYAKTERERLNWKQNVNGFEALVN